MNKENKSVAEKAKALLNVVIVKETRRENGSVRIQQDFTNCPTLAEQHTAHLSDLNYLIEKYQPDELQAYINARNQFRREIVGHDFTQELSLQEAGNLIHASKQEFENLPEEIKRNFRSHLEFIKFIDNPENANRMLKMGLLTTDQLNALRIEQKKAADAAEKQNVASEKKQGKTQTRTQDEDKE